MPVFKGFSVETGMQVCGRGRACQGNVFVAKHDKALLSVTWAPGVFFWGGGVGLVVWKKLRFVAQGVFVYKHSRMHVILGYV